MAMDRTVRVTLMAEVGRFVADLNVAASSVDKLAAKFDKNTEVQDKYTAAQRKAAAQAKQSAAETKQAWDKTSTGLLVAGGALLAGVGLAVKSASDFDAQMSAVKATGSDAARNIDALRQAALKAGRDFGQFSATDAADGITQLAKAGLSASDILGGALTGSLALAAAGQISVGDAAEVTAKTLSQFQLKGSDASHVADLLAAAAGKAVGDVGDFGQALAMAGTVSHQYGISVEETVGTLALFAQNALLGSDAGTSYKQMLLQLASPTKQAQQSLDEYNITAYDAQGKFVGMATLAEELKTKLGGLSQEQQNAALKTIFGGDAIRGATLLMKGGGKAVTDWTGQVKDWGYATATAGTKMDNLKGDLKALQGSLENLMIVAGSGSQGPLRGLVQELTKLTDWAGGHQQAAQTILAIVAAVGGFAVVAGGLMKATSAAAEFKVALSTLGVTASSAGTATGALIGMTTRLTLALGGAGLAVRALANDWDMPGITTAKAGLADLEKQTKGTTSALDKMFQQTDGSGDGLIAGVTNLDQALARAKGKWYDWLNNKADALAGITSESKALTEQFGKIDEALVGMSNSNATAAFSKISAAANQQGLSVEKLVSLFPQYKAQLEDTATSLGVTNLSAQDYADWMGGKIPNAIQAATLAQQSAGKSTEDYTRALTSQQQAAQAASQASQDLATSIQKAANAALAASGSEIGYQAAVDDATSSLKDYRDGLIKTAEDHGKGKVAAQAWADQQIKAGKALDINTEAGRKNKSALDGIAAGALAMLQKEQEATGVTDQLRKNQQMAHDDFVRVATAMGMSKSAAEAMAKQYGLVPEVIPTEVKLTGDKDAKKRIDDVKNAIDLTPRSKNIYVSSSFNNRGVRDASNALSGLPSSKTITITTKYNQIYYTSRQAAQGGPGAPMGYQADGSVLRFYAGGGLENHIAQIAPAGSWRVWAEPETGGEAYIPLNPAKRGRSLAILEEVARIFGRQVTPYAQGAVVPPVFQPGPVTASVGPVTARVHSGDIATLAAAFLQAVREGSDQATAPLVDVLTSIPTAARQGVVR